MVDFAQEVLPITIEEEMKQSYMEYAMSVIVGRALPDVRDGLKPVHRRVLYAMHEVNNDWNKAHKKSARIVGDVMGKYHPHGDSAIYDTIVRMAQPFSLRYMLVDGQGNFGSIDGDSAAAMRYTEVRMSKIAHELLADIEKETVDFVPNYDGNESEPSVLPSKIPNLLINGSAGIAVGLATNIPPHNITEVINGCLALIDDSEIDITGLMEHIPGPDFPTAAFINGSSGIHEAYHTGRGRIYLRSRSEIEIDEAKDKQKIIITELPYQVNKANLLLKIAELVKDKKIEGITELRDESDKDGLRMVIELRRGEQAEVVLNNLYSQTQLENVFGINMVALVDGQPKLLNLKQMLEAFVRHRREVVTRRTVFDLRKARERGHLLEGQAVALANIDEVIALIKASASPAEAKIALMERTWKPGIVIEMLERADADMSRPENLGPEFGLVDGMYRLSEAQTQSILELRLHRLTGLEQDKITGEYKEILLKIAELLEILTNADRLMEVIRSELVAVREEYSDERRSEILDRRINLTLEDLISEEDVVVTLSHGGYVKAQPLSMYQAQKRGGRGKSATAVKDEDFIDKLFIANTHDTMLCFSSRGKLYWKKVYELPQAGRAARGKPIVNLLPLEEGERITAVLPVREYKDDTFVFMATAHGIVKKTALTNFSRPRANGIIALELLDDDSLVGVDITDGGNDVMLLTNAGKAVRFHEKDVRSMGRTARGVKGIRLGKGQRVISLIKVDDADVLTVTEQGYGKRTSVEDYPVHSRGGQGVISIQTTERNGEVVGAALVCSENELMLISDNGTLVRTRVEEISQMSRNTQGVRLIKLSDGESLIGIEVICEPEDEAEVVEETAEVKPESSEGEV